ncbi:IclR family transcriptional regulator [Glutamicibacter mysorens]
MSNKIATFVPSFGNPPQYPLESVDNALKVIYLLGNRGEMRLSEVAEALGVASSTAHRLLATLHYRGFTAQNTSTKTYKPGPALSNISYAVLQKFDIRLELQPALMEINKLYGETAHLAVLDGDSVRYIDALESPKPVRVASRVGKVIPASSSSSGKMLLSQLSDAELRNLFPNEKLQSINSRSLHTFEELQKELQLTRDRKFAINLEESEDGVYSVAALVPEDASPLRVAIGLSMPTNRANIRELKLIGEDLVQTITNLFATTNLLGS